MQPLVTLAMASICLLGAKVSKATERRRHVRNSANLKTQHLEYISVSAISDEVSDGARASKYITHDRKVAISLTTLEFGHSSLRMMVSWLRHSRLTGGKWEATPFRVTRHIVSVWQ
jgi:hypothetical protein